jgi:hypothetical protein
VYLLRSEFVPSDTRNEEAMPSIDTMQAATPVCPGLSTNLMHHLRAPGDRCARAMRWQHDAEIWVCAAHGPRVTGAEAATQRLLGDIAA